MHTWIDMFIILQMQTYTILRQIIDGCFQVIILKTFVNYDFLFDFYISWV